ncbi:MAG: DUF2280 domain-containing protein [Bacteroidetes bacterium]|jgi:hypothetical protein|nr:DUF2280 domain-containing protein [Bacteroidota bacterium]
MAILKSYHKELIVKNLACCVSPTEVQSYFIEHFNMTLSFQQICYYDPDQSPMLSKKWRHMFTDIRQNYINEIGSIPIANKGFRLQEMQRNYFQLRNAGNIMGAQAILEQAAKEVGGVYDGVNSAKAYESGRKTLYDEINDYLLGRDKGTD